MPFSVPYTNDNWLRLSILVHHHVLAAALKLIHDVFPPSDTQQLYADLQRLIAFRPPKTFKNEKELMVPSNALVTNTAAWDITLIHKIFTECLNAKFVCNNGKSFQTPKTGVSIPNPPPLQLPSLTGTNSGDHLNLLKSFRNVLAHWPNQQMSKQDFDTCWAFLIKLLTAVGIDCTPLADLEYGAYLTSENFASLVCIMKEKDRKIGKL